MEPKSLKGDEYEQAEPPIVLYKSQRPYALAEKIVASLEKQLDQNNAFSIVLWPSG